MRRIIRRIITFTLILLCLSFPVNADAQTYKSTKDVYNIIRENLINHKTSFTIRMSNSTMDKIEKVDLFDAVTALDDKATSKDGDYLKLSVDTWHESWIRSSLGTTTLTISVVYKSTADQEKKVDAKVKSVLNGLKLTNATDYQKVKAIHNYIIKRVSYDQTYSKYTAYDALIKKTAVCEGYTAVAYRMFTDAGIECRIITGIADGGAHSWNIVKVDGKWYNIDLTWDDPITNTGEQILTYNYFLKNEKAFGGHIRDKQFSTEQFLKAYPIAVNSYKATE